MRLGDVPPALRAYLPGVHSPAEFDDLIRKLDRRAALRLEEGERDALVYYVLQAHAFTSLPPIDPAAAARRFFEEDAVSADVRERFAAFAAACGAAPHDARLRYFCALGHAGADLAAEYPRALRFLYRKEFESQQSEGDARRAFVAALYRSRGLSTDSAFDANFPVFLALRRLAADPALRLDRVLVVGPGLEFAPRTHLDDSIPPQSIQPYAVADALLQLRLSTPDRLRIHCLDYSPRVVDYFSSGSPPRLVIARHPGPEKYGDYFAAFGAAIGGTRLEGERKVISVSASAARLITAERLNIATRCPAPAPPYDLIVATNVLVYLDREELALAFANFASLLREGGYLVHNELRGEVEPMGAAAGLPVIDARMIRLLETDRRALYDGQVIHRKGSSL